MFFFFFDEFCKNVVKLINEAGIENITEYHECQNKDTQGLFDFLGKRDSVIYGFDIKQYTAIKSSINTINEAAESLVLKAKLFSNDLTPVLIVSCVIDGTTRSLLKKIYPKVLFIDIANLLYAVWNVEELKNDLVSSLSYNLDYIKPTEGPLNLTLLSHSNYTESLIKELKMCNTGKMYFRTYEDLCQKLLKNVFSNNLTLWKKQENSNNNLYRFDLICRIKEENKTTFWSIIEKFFNSKYIIFEFKNYNSRITQNEIYTTEKYLYSKALRCVAIIIAATGYDDNAQWAAKGILREHGKLILLLDSNDLIKMNEMKLKSEEPSAYLLDRLDKLLLELEK